MSLVVHEEGFSLDLPQLVVRRRDFVGEVQLESIIPGLLFDDAVNAYLGSGSRYAEDVIRPVRDSNLHLLIVSLLGFDWGAGPEEGKSSHKHDSQQGVVHVPRLHGLPHPYVVFTRVEAPPGPH